MTVQEISRIFYNVIKSIANNVDNTVIVKDNLGKLEGLVMFVHQFSFFI